MPRVFLSRTPAGLPIEADFDHKVSRIVTLGLHKVILPRYIGKRRIRTIGFGWWISWHVSAGEYYIHRRTVEHCILTTEYLHRFLHKLKTRDGYAIRFKDGCSLNMAESNMEVYKTAICRSKVQRDHYLGRSRTGHYAVYQTPKGRFVARPKVPDRERPFLGSFLTALEAARAVNTFLIQHDPSDYRINHNLLRTM